MDITRPGPERDLNLMLQAPNGTGRKHQAGKAVGETLTRVTWWGDQLCGFKGSPPVNKSLAMVGLRRYNYPAGSADMDRDSKKRSPGEPMSRDC
jgi:hypothetical protein